MRSNTKCHAFLIRKDFFINLILIFFYYFTIKLFIWISTKEKEKRERKKHHISNEKEQK